MASNGAVEFGAGVQGGGGRILRDSEGGMSSDARRPITIELNLKRGDAL